MKKSGVRRGVLVYKGPDPAGKMKIPAEGTPQRGEGKQRAVSPEVIERDRAFEATAPEFGVEWAVPGW